MSAYKNTQWSENSRGVDIGRDGGIHVSVNGISATNDSRIFAGLNVEQLILAGESLLAQIITWLHPIDHTIIHNVLASDRSPETGEWLLERVKDWICSSSRCMWAYGDVGCGKSTLCSNVLEHYFDLLDPEDKHPILVYFYCTFRDTQTFDVETLYRSLIAQLCRLDDWVLTKVAAVYTKNRPYQPSNKLLHDTLISILEQKREDSPSDSPPATIRPITVILDGLDEIPSGPKRDAVINLIEKIAGLISQPRLLIFSREEVDIRETLKPSSGWQHVPIPRKDVEDDIGTFVDAELAKGRKLRRLDDLVKKKIRDSLAVESKGMFRLAALQMIELAKMSAGLNPEVIDEVLENLPKELDEYYDVIVKRLPVHLGQTLLNAMQWLVFAARPMFIEEIVEACAVGKNKADSTLRYSPRRRLNPLDICEYLSGLVALDPPVPNPEDAIITENAHVLTLAHFSVREYLLPNITPRPVGLWRLVPDESQRFIAQGCLAYIYYCCSEGSNKADYPLKAYAWLFWAVHLSALETHTYKSDITSKSLLLHNTIYFPDLYACEDERLESNIASFKTLVESVSIPKTATAFFRAIRDPTFLEDLQDGRDAGPIYRSLGTCPGTVRFLILEPSVDPKAPLICKLCTDTIDNAPKYTALTYTWGGLPADHVIILNGRNFPVRATLMYALYQLRLRDEPRVLWIDALCISMQDLEERSSQITLMAELYGNAVETIVWLGQDDVTEGAAVAMLRCEDIKEQLTPANFGITGVDRTLRLLNKFLDLPLWRRSWSIQELVSARKATIYWWKSRLAWKDLPDFKNLKEYLQPLLFNDRVWYDESPERVFHAGWDAISAIQQLAERKSTSRPISLPEVLYLARSHKASDPRDRVYALLSLVPESVRKHPLIRADYALTTDEIYTRIMAYLLQERKDLDLLGFVLCHAEDREMPSQDSDLPSWVPTWSDNTVTPLCADLGLAGQPPLYSAGNMGISKSSITIQLTEGLEQVTVSGFAVDRIVLEERPRIVLEAEHIASRRYRTSWADLYIQPNGVISRLGPSKKYSFRHAIEEEELRRSRDLDECTRWQVASKDHDYACLVPWSAEHGDLIVVFLGASVPFILRPVRDCLMSIDASLPYRLVGEAYVHGIMDGEILDEWRSGQKTIEQFTLL